MSSRVDALSAHQDSLPTEGVLKRLLPIRAAAEYSECLERRWNGLSSEVSCRL